jgi:hypothetical protein
MKKFYFLCGMPRAGNTLLGSLINQNKNIEVTSNSIVPAILSELYKLKESLVFKNFPDHISFDNVYKNVFKNYYNSWDKSVIIERAPWGLSGNLYLLKKIIKDPAFIILYRPVLKCLASFVNIHKPNNIENYCDELMNKEYGIVGKSLFSINNLINNKEKYTIIHYNDIVKNPTKEIKKIFSFINLKYKKININKINQFSANNVYYDDSVLSASLHKLKTNKIEKSNYSINKILPKQIIDKYSNLDIL